MVQNDNLFDAIELNNFIGQKILSAIEEAIHKEIGFKQFCFDIQKDERQIRDALNGNKARVTGVVRSYDGTGL